MLRLFCFALMLVIPVAALGAERIVLVDTSLIIRGIADAIGADYVGLPQHVELPAADAAVACGTEPQMLINQCSAVLPTPELVEAMGDELS
ncbi:hypothetical protein [Devosia sp. RR2S18]|uniref:hypothetical protein n=1 Tax=Devosia rhizosphaerae TaxID=3049774 RepID=UPI002540D42A|nr:hypothetical protein [Devosia sp. RR2S18]WIJ23421.1 hypothetical protein QOV41_09995 [Devosia sp. RR2S18]